jgi:O-acetylserine/cysteine efflux transporter
VNLEPLVGAAAGAVVFGDPVGLAQAAGGAAILGGIALSSLPLLRPRPAAVAIHPGRVRTDPPRLDHAAA